MSRRTLVLEGGGDALLVLLPGFLNTPAAYDRGRVASPLLDWWR